MLILLLTTQGCASGFRTLAERGEVSDNPRDCFEPGDMARLTLRDGSQIAGEVTQLRLESITLGDTEVQWSEVVRAESYHGKRSRLAGATWATVVVGVLALAIYGFAYMFEGLRGD